MPDQKDQPISETPAGHNRPENEMTVNEEPANAQNTVFTEDDPAPAVDESGLPEEINLPKETGNGLVLLNLSERKMRRMVIDDDQGFADTPTSRSLVKSGMPGWLDALPLKQKLIAFGLVILLAVGALGAAAELSSNGTGGSESGLFSKAAEAIGLKEPPATTKAATRRDSLQLSKEYVYAGSRMLAVEDYGVSGGTPTPTPTPPVSGNTATFVRSDTTTQGNWIGAYGSQGYQLAGDATNLPTWAQATFNGNGTHPWAASTTDGRALKKAANNGDRLAVTWYTQGTAPGSNYTVAFNFTDGQEHQLAFYNLDWDNYNGRAQQLEVLDGTSGTVLDTRSVANFTNGIYTIWKVKGQVTVKISNQTNGSNAVISGFFLDAANTPPPPTPTPSTPTPTPTPTPGVAPTAPTIAQVITNSHTQLDVYWNQPPAAQNVTSYNLRVNGGQVIPNITYLSYPVTGLTPGTAYSFDVQAVNQYGTSGWSPAASGTTSTPGAPPVPTIASVGQNSNPTCLDITLNGVAGANSYDVQIIGSGHTVNVTALSFPWCGLAPSTYNEYKARSIGTYGTSGWSANVGGTTANPPPPATNNSSPQGNFDGIDSNVYVSGWSYDPDDPNYSNDVHVYIGGPAGSGTGYATTANQSRPDVNSAFGISGNHGFYFQIPAQHQTGQWTPVYIYGIDRGTNSPVLLNGSPHYFGTPPDPTPTPCNSNSGDVDWCENVMGKRWNYDTCTCENPSDDKQSAAAQQQEKESDKGVWDSFVETVSGWWN